MFLQSACLYDVARSRCNAGIRNAKKCIHEFVSNCSNLNHTESLQVALSNEMQKLRLERPLLALYLLRSGCPDQLQQ